MENMEHNEGSEDPKEFVSAPRLHYFGSVDENLQEGRVLALAHPCMTQPIDLQGFLLFGRLVTEVYEPSVKAVAPLVPSRTSEPSPIPATELVQTLFDEIKAHMNLYCEAMAEVANIGIEAGAPEEMVREHAEQDAMWFGMSLSWLETALQAQRGRSEIEGFTLGFARPEKVACMSSLALRELLTFNLEFPDEDEL